MQMAVQKRKTLMPIDWWTSYGIGCPDLQKFFIRVLGLTCSASSCERNWSTFERLHTKKRNRLQHKKLNDLVYVTYNQILKQRYDERKRNGSNIDPIILREVDDNEEWPSDDENVYENDDSLTWDHVDIACGASQETGGASTRATQKKGKQKMHDSSTRNQKQKYVAFDVDEEEEMSSGDSDDEEEDSLHLEDDSDDDGLASSSSDPHSH
ncbi:unnamed protein product [Victoria cruziana]